MFRFSIACCVLFSQLALLLNHGEIQAAENEENPAVSRADFDWSAWKRLPVLHDGRIKPIDTLADEVTTLIVGRTKWTDPQTEVEYPAHELLYLWITDPDTWFEKPVIRCEYRPLRKVLAQSDDVDIPAKGTFVSVSDVIYYGEDGRIVFHVDELRERLDRIERERRKARMQGDDPPSPDSIGDTSDERALNGKVAELINHLQKFLGTREARNVFVVPGLDPRILTKQTNPDAALPNWVSLGALLRYEEWKQQQKPDVTVAAIMAQDPQELMDQLVFRGHYQQLRQQIGGPVPLREDVLEGFYPVKHLPQLAKIQKFKDQLRVAVAEIPPALKATRSAYDQGNAVKFASAMQTFERKIRRLAERMEETRQKMEPPEEQAINFGELNAQIWQKYQPLELDQDQMSRSAYPAPDSTNLELVYNRHQPFERAWLFFLLATIVLIFSMMVKAQRSVFIAALIVSAGAIAYSTWGFGLRIAISGRPPVATMYDTVIWVSYVVAILGFWFCLIPLIWPGLQWAWRLSGYPLRLKRNEQGSIAGVELDDPGPDERHRFLAKQYLPIQLGTSVLRLVGFLGIVWFTTNSGTSYEIISLAPPDYSTLSLGSLFTWCIGMTTVLITAWVLPRAVMSLAGGIFLAIPEARNSSQKLWEQTLGRRFYLIGALPVAFFGMLLAYQVGVRSPDIMDPRIGSINAVLRDNYWLTIHVLTIVSSYAAGALAWGIGNVAMLYYLVGRYRKGRVQQTQVETDAQESKAQTESAGPVFDRKAADKIEQGEAKEGIFSRLKRTGSGLKPTQIGKTIKAGFRDFGSADDHLTSAQTNPPQEVSTLATFGYKAMQVAVLLLAAGTILGGLWADKSWGRFWDWDPKEVWALISLLVYLAVLHGRFAGWVGTFGTNVSTVLCFMAILMSWYGVNFVLPQIHGWLSGTGEATPVGLHSYAVGSGGLGYVVIAVLINLSLVLAAWSRYAVETMDILGPGQAAKSEPVDEESPQEPVEETNSV